MSSSTSPYMSSSSDYNTDRAEWINRIENSHIDRNLMNKLVMNYLVTGNFPLRIKVKIFLLIFFRGFQRSR